MAYKVLNFNIGVLGHVDSGKTSLVKALSTVASTAAFDKHPQSQERGITLDLGFSSFFVDFPSNLVSSDNTYDKLQFTLVDCPGHASLIRTIIGGAQIIDMMILVIDVTKGIQTQTAECLVIGEITCDRMLVVINKIDLLPDDKKDTLMNKMKKKILKTLEKTKFRDAEVVFVAASPSGSNVQPVGIQNLIDTLCKHVYVPQRSADGPLIFAVDHCFAIKGQGTVMTGTVIQGSVSLSETVEIPSSKTCRKVKSIQMFKKPVSKAIQGDRIGMCVTQFDPSTLERGVICSPGYMESADVAIATVEKIPYFKGKCCNNSKFHISIMHDTVMAKCTFFRLLETKNIVTQELQNNFLYEQDFICLDELGMGEIKESTESVERGLQFALFQFEKPVILSKNSILIGSKLDTDIHSNVCRLAFHGKIVELFNTKQHFLAMAPNLKICKIKEKKGLLDRIVNEYEIICKDLFKKETNIQLFVNFEVNLSTGETGFIEGSFGQSGKVKIRVPNGLSPEAAKHIQKKKGKKEQVVESGNLEPIHVVLKFKKYIYDKKKIIQL